LAEPAKTAGLAISKMPASKRLNIMSDPLKKVLFWDIINKNLFYLADFSDAN
jgi:hypothetical protein